MLQIRTTGLENYLPGGEANIKTMIVGGQGVGKTRFASFWPQPLWANCESGMASVADRGMPYVDIRTSQDMLEWLKLLKQECSRPRAERRWRTAVVDTLDSFQRKVKDEYLQAHPQMESFSGFDAWGYLDAKMQMLMTRLLNLDMNIVVLVHYKDKTRTEGMGDAKVEVVERMLQLQGDTKDSAFNDFDLVGRMDTYWASDGEKRVEKRGLTFQRTPDWPFLKDRLHVTPPWMEVTFADSDYDQLFAAVMSRVDDLPESTVLEEVAEIPDDNEIKGAGVVGALGGGPVPPTDPKDMPLQQLKKDELLQMARGMESIKDQVKSNLLKAEIIDLIDGARHAEAVEEVKQPAQQVDDGQTVVQAPAEGAAVQDSGPEASTPVQAPEAENLPEGTERMPDGRVVDTAGGGEILTPEQVAERLDATVESKEPQADASSTASAPTPAPEASDEACEGCAKSLVDENPDYVTLSQIKFRKKLCTSCYQAAKKAAR